MPIHHKIIYNLSTGDHDCFSSSSTTVTLVQHAIVQFGRSYVDQIDIIYSPDATGTPPESSFTLTMTDTSYSITPITRSVLTTDNGSTHSVTNGGTAYAVVFGAPTDPGDVLFEFGSSSGPGTKLKVKVKRQTTTFTCS